jgi:hypothetical protein
MVMYREQKTCAACRRAFKTTSCERDRCFTCLPRRSHYRNIGRADARKLREIAPAAMCSKREPAV